MKIRNIEVSVKVDEVALQELDVNTQDQSATCFIPSEEGANFCVCLQNSTANAIESRVYLDGVHAQSYVTRPEKSSSMKGTHITQETLRPFLFAPLRLTDDEAALMPSQEDLEALGTIRVDIFRVIWRGYLDNFTNKRGLEQFDSERAVHERTKKAGSHRVKLGDPIHTRTNTIDVDYIDPGRGDPYMRFTFRYRPKGMLQAQGLIPLDDIPIRRRPRSASPGRGGSSSDDDVVEVKDEGKLKDLMAQRAALDSQIRAAKRRKVKREQSPIVLGAMNGEVIDLTGD